MDNMQFTIAYALRLGVEPFADIKPGHKCRLCGKKIGTSAMHGSLCTRGGTGTDARNERHYALNAEVARILRFCDPTLRIRFEPSIVRDFHKQPFNWKMDARRRGDLQVRSATANYIIDTSVGSAAAASAPPAANFKAGSVARQLAQNKVVHYTGSYRGFREHEIKPFCAESEGSLDTAAKGLAQAAVDTGYSNSDQSVSKAVFAGNVFSRLSVALQRANGDGVLRWRYAEVGEAAFDAPCDPVYAALNSPPRDLSECDRDLRTAAAAEEE